MKTHTNGFQCYRCGTRQASDFAGYNCPVCGGNLEVTYEWPRIKPVPGWWKEEARGDIFRYAALLPVTHLEWASPLQVGMTPLYSAPRLGALAGLNRLYVKDDGQNPSASFKDRAGAVALVRARETGATVLCGASTGNAGSSMACLAASVGMPCVIFVPEKAPTAKIAQLLVFGATVLAVQGTYDDAFDLCMEVCDRRGWFNRNTGHNPFTREGKKTAAFELFEQLGRVPDWVAVSSGDGNILSGLWKGFRDLKDAGIADRLPKMLCVQSDQSNAIATTVRRVADSGERDWGRVAISPVSATTVADSISVDVPRDGLAAVRAVIESGGAALTVLDEAILAAIPELARASGVFAEPAAACAWAGVRAAASTGLIHSEETVVCLCTGNGLKDVSSARKVAGEPVSIAANVDAAMWATDALG
ncbi:MAG: threonine synthase [Verrucomicrobiota bacterium]|jgi:threonine synthase|nr:threonine synthase [Verrucomicrobiota bacterium]